MAVMYNNTALTFHYPWASTLSVIEAVPPQIAPSPIGISDYGCLQHIPTPALGCAIAPYIMSAMELTTHNSTTYTEIDNI